ncbi:MAG: MFS transporter [Pirellulales bacterium]|nr:MFS transporter [Pirellulales bacterium]
MESTAALTTSRDAGDDVRVEPAPIETADLRGGLLSRSFLGFLATQFLGALNDNMFRWLVVPIGKDLVGEEHAAAALSAGLACFVLPYVLLAAPAGYLADRFSKRTVIVGCKVAEIIIMALGVAAILSRNVYVMFVVVALMGGQSALFGPSKLGSIPELVRARSISAANGLVGLTTVLAIVLGTVAGNCLYTLTCPLGSHLWGVSAAALLGVAIVGWFASLQIRPLRPANPAKTLPVNFFGQTLRDLRALGHSRALLRAALGTAFFWSLGAMAQMNIDVFGITELGVQQQYIGPLLATLALGVGVGSVLAGVWSAGKVELGIVPLGAGLIALSSILLFGVPTPAETSIQDAYGWTCACLFALGLGAGLFDVPLQAFLQERSPEASRGAILAASNFITFSGMLLAAGAFWVFRNPLGLSARGIFLVAGLSTVPVFLYIVWLLPGATVRSLVWLASRTIYRVRVVGMDNLPERGGALLVANHVSWIDGVLLILTSSRLVRMVAFADYIDRWWIRWLAREMGAIPIRDSRKSMVEAIRAARDALRAGDLVCIFPEGHLTRTGTMQAFRPGFLSILKNTGAPLVPVYLHGLWGSVFSFEGGKFFWKWPRQWPYPVSILFGKPLVEPTDIQNVRRSVEKLGVEAMRGDPNAKMIPARRFLRMCRRAMRRSKVADSTGAELTGAGLLARSLILRRLLRREALADDERNVGVLMPPTTAGVVVNAALALDGRVVSNLNYSVRSPDTLNECLRQAGIRHVITSRRVMERLQIPLDAEFVYLEDLVGRITWADKVLCAAATWLLPVAVLERLLGLTRIDPDDLLTIIFTSGSTGAPKGVMLTHHNVGCDVSSFAGIMRLRREDVLVGVLPFFHSFGYTVTLWAVLMLEPKGVYHPNPLEPKPIGQLTRRHGGTLLLSTPTFLRSYLRRIEPEDFATLDTVITGAEKLPKDLADAFEARFGVRPAEGYGTTELSPAVAANIPACRLGDTSQVALREGSIGRPLPGVAARVVDLDTGKDLDVNQTGMLLVTGPIVMKGYLGRPDLTAEVLRDGWYVTGDVARIDEDGFIFITGRVSRFSKIGGEMVPHIHVEEAICRALDLDEDDVRVAVTGVPDPRKGERLIVLHTPLTVPPEEICRKLSEAGLPPLWIPSPDSFCEVSEIPVLGTGKLALKDVRDLAMARYSGSKKLDHDIGSNPW